MRIFATTLDGTINDFEVQFYYALIEKFDLDPEEIAFDKVGWASRTGVPHMEIVEFRKECRANLDFLNTLTCREPIAKAMNDWAWKGLVPSVLSDRSRENRLMTELWLSQNSVPYSNLLFEVEYPFEVLHYIDATFFFDTNVVACIDAAQRGFRSYVISTALNASDVKQVQSLAKWAMLFDGMLTVVEDISDITRLEGI